MKVRWLLLWVVALLPAVVGAAENQPKGHYRTLATNAVGDMLTHFWSGDTTTGQIVNTWCGYPPPPPLKQERGSAVGAGHIVFCPG